MNASEPVIFVDGLRRSYGGVEAVRDVSFSVGRGEVLGLLGPNGAGKTTTIEILEGFRRRDAGTVRVLGLDPGKRADVAQLHKRLGVVLQQTGHYRFLRVGEVMRMHAGYHDAPRDIAEVLSMTGLTGLERRYVRELSGGELRRLDVAVALIGSPEAIFLDEPTTGFDPAARRRMWDLVASLRDLGTTVLLTTHYMEEAQALADRVAIMRDGRIADIGTPDEIALRLQLGSTITCTVPSSTRLADLPDALAGATLDDGALSLTTHEPTSVLAALTSWALAHDLRLDDLRVAPPSLEQSYLAIAHGDGVRDEVPAVPTVEVLP